MKNKINLRSLAAQAIEQVVEQGQSLSNVLPPLQQKVSDKDKALLQELCFGVLRTLSQLEWLINKLMARPMTGKQRTVHFLIMVGLYQLLYTRIPPHAALAETVEGAVAIKRPQLKGLINGVLRQFQRQQEALLVEFAEHENRYLHPKWLLKRLQQAWPQQWQEIVDANNQRPPMWLRVNRNHHSRDEWLALLKEAGLEGFTHLTIPTPCVWPPLPQSMRCQVLPKAGSPSRMPRPRAVCATCCRKMANAFSIFAPHRAARRRIFWRLPRRLRSWRWILMNSVCHASMTT